MEEAKIVRSLLLFSHQRHNPLLRTNNPVVGLHSGQTIIWHKILPTPYFSVFQGSLLDVIYVWIYCSVTVKTVHKGQLRDPKFVAVVDMVFVQK